MQSTTTLDLGLIIVAAAIVGLFVLVGAVVATIVVANSRKDDERLRAVTRHAKCKSAMPRDIRRATAPDSQPSSPL
jgi:hypothetical protein